MLYKLPTSLSTFHLKTWTLLTLISSGCSRLQLGDHSALATCAISAVNKREAGISRGQFILLQGRYRWCVGWIILRKPILSLHSLWGDSKWLGWSTLLTFSWLKLDLLTIILHSCFIFFMHGYVYLLCIHHDILEQSHKREKVWCLPLTSLIPLESLRKQYV